VIILNKTEIFIYLFIFKPEKRMLFFQGIQFIMGETNSCSCGGEAGVSFYFVIISSHSTHHTQTPSNRSHATETPSGHTPHQHQAIDHTPHQHQQPRVRVEAKLGLYFILLLYY
jgi:hypothetical protein